MLGDPCRPQAQGDRCDRRSVRPLHPAGHSRLYPVRQRTGVPRQGSTGMDRGCRCQGRLHRARQPRGERVHRELQRSPARRAARRRNLLHSPRGPNRHRELAAALQHDQAARIARIQAASSGGICPCLRRVAGCATPTGSAGHASATASLKLTFHLDHSVGANHHRRQFLHLAAGAAALPAVSRIARAQTYPSRPVRIVVGFTAGGAGDITARLIGQWLSERLGQQFVIDNRPGGGTNIGAEAVVRASPDGYTLLIVGTAQAINATLYDKLNFHFIRDIAPVAGVLRGPYVMVVNPSVPAKSVPEFIAYAKANPRKLNMASAGTGTGSHIAGELFKMMAGVNLVHVPYLGAGPALTDLLGGQVQVYFPSTPASIEYIRAGRLHALAVTAGTRLDVLPDIPTVAEFVPGLRSEFLVRRRRAERHAC